MDQEFVGLVERLETLQLCKTKHILKSGFNNQVNLNIFLNVLSCTAALYEASNLLSTLKVFGGLD